ncbi:MAG: prepilin-type N-terminal cleavage/methylation domain-containing protein [Armatimonadetes bacterium]|nr:prepilin-type N-terminal cleavage/methylation domain-containing protein [Armatimonadota bacterium]
MRRDRASRRWGPGGFSLVELLVALVIMGTLAGGLSLAFSTSLDAHRRLRREGDTAQELRIVLDALRADIQQAALTPGSTRSWFIGTDEGDEENLMDTLRLTTRSHRVALRDVNEATEWELLPRHADWSAVTYGILPADEEAAGYLYRQEQIPPGEDPLEELETVEVLSRAIIGLNCRYFDGVDWQETWDSQEENLDTLPRAVEVTLVLAPESEDAEPRSVVAVFPVRLATLPEESETAGSGLAGPSGLLSAPAAGGDDF